MPEFKAGGEFEPEEYMEYFEDSDSTPNAEIGCKMPFMDGHQLIARIQLAGRVPLVGMIAVVNEPLGKR